MSPSTRSSRSLPVLPDDAADFPQRPRTRGDCQGGQRPCPFVGCRHHLALEVRLSGDLALILDPEHLDAYPDTCALDVADRGAATFEEIGRLLGVSRQRVEQVERRALAKVRKRASSLPSFQPYRELGLMPDDPPITAPSR